MYPTRGFDEVHRVVVMFLDTGRNRKNIRIKNNVLRIEIGLVDQQTISAFADFNFASVSIGLAFSSKAMTITAAP